MLIRVYILQMLIILCVLVINFVSYFESLVKWHYSLCCYYYYHYYHFIFLLFLWKLSLQIPEGGTGDSGRERTKTFTYDFSFYSADTKSPDYVSQEMVQCDSLKIWVVDVVVFLLRKQDFPKTLKKDLLLFFAEFNLYKISIW